MEMMMPVINQPIKLVGGLFTKGPIKSWRLVIKIIGIIASGKAKLKVT